MMYRTNESRVSNEFVVLLRMSLLLPVPRSRRSHGPVDHLRPDLDLPEVIHEFRLHGEKGGPCARSRTARTSPSRP
jgi:hypothetical protein